MNPQRFSEGELIFLRAILGVEGDPAGRLGRDVTFTTQSEGSTVYQDTCVTFAVDGVMVELAVPGVVQEGESGGMEVRQNVALDLGRLLKVAACVAQCVLGTSGESARENAQTAHDVKPSNAKPTK